MIIILDKERWFLAENVESRVPGFSVECPPVPNINAFLVSGTVAVADTTTPIRSRKGAGAKKAESSQTKASQQKASADAEAEASTSADAGSQIVAPTHDELQALASKLRRKTGMNHLLCVYFAFR